MNPSPVSLSRADRLALVAGAIVGGQKKPDPKLAVGLAIKILGAAEAQCNIEAEDRRKAWEKKKAAL